MSVDVILGLQWGDEGKGKIVDALSPAYQVIARFQGGPNAGHTLEFDGKKVVLHTIPSGIFHDDKKNVIGNGVVLDPLVFFRELETVENLHPGASRNLIISKRAHLITPTHRLLDAALEHAKGDAKIGSTLKGIAPAYTDKYSRSGLRIGDLLRSDFAQCLDKLASAHLNQVKMMGYSPGDFTIDKISFDEFDRQWRDAVMKLRDLDLADTEIYLNDCIGKGMKILAEGAQGTLLDIDFGSYPFVTSSNTSCGGVCTGLGLAPKHIGTVYGIFKAYCTRVGSGPFPTELFDETGRLLQSKGHEFGATTGRPRRCGWLDLVALKYAVLINGVDRLIMTKADVLDDFDSIYTADAYLEQGREIFHPPYEIYRDGLSPRLTANKGWKQDTTAIRRESDLPPDLKAYSEHVMKYTSVPVQMISVGPDREQMVKLKV